MGGGGEVVDGFVAGKEVVGDDVYAGVGAPRAEDCGNEELPGGFVVEEAFDVGAVVVGEFGEDLEGVGGVLFHWVSRSVRIFGSSADSLSLREKRCVT